MVVVAILRWEWKLLRLVLDDLQVVLTTKLFEVVQTIWFDWFMVSWSRLGG